MIDSLPNITVTTHNSNLIFFGERCIKNVFLQPFVKVRGLRGPTETRMDIEREIIIDENVRYFFVSYFCMKIFFGMIVLYDSFE